MTIDKWIGPCLTLAGIAVTFFLAHKQGLFKRYRLEFTPAKTINPLKDGVIEFKQRRKPYIPVIAIIRFFKYHKTGYQSFCSHIYLTLNNRSKYAIEDINMTLTYPRRNFDESDKHFFKAEQTADNDYKATYTIVNDETIQINYRIKTIHPFGLRSFMHPLIQPIAAFTEPQAEDDPFLSAVSEKTFSYYRVDVSITAQNLPKPIHTNFWVVDVLNSSYMDFFKREKVFLHDLTKGYSYAKHVVEIQKIDTYNPGKFKKEILVVKPEYPEISYSHFAPIKEPYNSQWNFDQT